MNKTLAARMAAIENATMARMFAAVETELAMMPPEDKRRIAAESDQGRNVAVIHSILCAMLAKHGLLQALDVLKDKQVKQ